MIDTELFELAIELRDMINEIWDDAEHCEKRRIAANTNSLRLAEGVIVRYTEESTERVQARIAAGSFFTDAELVYAEQARCHCGYGLAYPDGCGSSHWWECSEVLKGNQKLSKMHTWKIFFGHTKITGESETSTTRGGKLEVV